MNNKHSFDALIVLNALQEEGLKSATVHLDEPVITFDHFSESSYEYDITIGLHRPFTVEVERACVSEGWSTPIIHRTIGDFDELRVFIRALMKVIK